MRLVEVDAAEEVVQAAAVQQRLHVAAGEARHMRLQACSSYQTTVAHTPTRTMYKGRSTTGID